MSSIGFHTATTKKKKWLIFPRAWARQAVPYLIKQARLRSAGHLISPFGVCWISDIAQLQLPVVQKCCRQSWLTKRSPLPRRHLRHWQRLLTGYFTVLQSFLTTKVSAFCPWFLRLFSTSDQRRWKKQKRGFSLSFHCSFLVPWEKRGWEKKEARRGMKRKRADRS